MNLATITSIFRHWLTAAAGVLGLWLIANLALSGDESKQLTEALAKLIEPTVAVLGLVGVAVARLAIKWLGKVFRHGSGELENGGPSGGIGLLLMITAAALGGALPSCSTATAPDGTVTRKPDAESISLGREITSQLLSAWQTEQAAKRDVKVAKASVERHSGK